MRESYKKATLIEKLLRHKDIAEEVRRSASRFIECMC